MITRRGVEVAGACLALGMLGFVIKGWELETKARDRAEDVARVSATEIAAKDREIASRDKLAAATDATIAAQAAALRTPQQAVQVLVRTLPPSPTGASPASPAVVTRDELPAAVQAKLPDAASYTLFTDRQTVDLARNALACRSSQNDIMSCKADLTDTRTELTAETATAQAWQTAAKGGSKFHRLVHVLELTGCAAAAGYAGSRLDKLHPGNGAALGAAGGVIACSVF